MPFFLEIKAETDAGRLLCTKVLRILPGKRVVVLGLWRDRTVVAKVYLAPGAARKHAERELQGVRALEGAGVRTPSVLLEGGLSGDNSPVLVFEEVPKSRTLAEILAPGQDPGVQKRLLEKAIHIIAELHAKGLVQRDIHPANFLFSDGELFAIDADSLDAPQAGKPLGQWPSLVNLGLFLAQFPGDFEPFFPELYRLYAGLRDWEAASCSYAELERHIAEQWGLRKTRYLRKIFRSSTEHISRKDWSRYSVWRRDWDSEDIRAFLANPDGYMSKGEMLKDGKSSTVVAVRMNDQRVVVKRYNLKNPWHALRRCLRNTRASVSWRNSHLLAMIGIRTPAPVLLHERRCAFFRGTAYLVNRYVEGRPLQGLFINSIGEVDCAGDSRVQEVLRLFLLFRKYRVSHGDMKATNFLEKDGALWVMDLDAMKEHRGEASHRRAQAKDCARWMKNWNTLPKVADCFRISLEEAGFP